MSETGTTVLLRGHGSGNSEIALGEGSLLLHITFCCAIWLSWSSLKILIAIAILVEAQQPLHLLLSSNDPISLERAKLLAENLLDTISAECGASR